MPQSVQTPYQPGPYQSGPYGAPTPAPSYGYPQSAPAYQSQAPMSPMQQQTPPPYTIAPQPQARSGGGDKRNMPVVVGSIVVALIAIGGLITVLSLKGSDTGGDPAANDSSAASEHKAPERNRTMRTEDCTDALEDNDDPHKVDAPSFLYKDILSAKTCANAAGWTIKEIKIPGNAYAEDQVIDQFPTSGTAVPKTGAHFELRIATGDPA
jgi:hypothetical protein